MFVENELCELMGWTVWMTFHLLQRSDLIAIYFCQFNHAEALLWVLSVTLNQLNGIGWDENSTIPSVAMEILQLNAAHVSILQCCLFVWQLNMFLSITVNWMSCFRSKMEWVMINCTLEGKPLVGAHYCNLWMVPIRGRRMNE